MFTTMRPLACILVIWFSIASAGQGQAEDAPPSVVASIVPVHSLVAAVMQGVGEPILLIEGGASPHTASLRPSEASALQRADVVFWVGSDLETLLEKPLSALADRARVVALADAPGVTLLDSREGGVWDDPHHATESDGDAEHGHGDDAHEHGHDHDHDGHGHEHHAHGDHDVHIWLDPRNAMAMADAIAKSLSEADPAHAETYAANAAALQQRLEALDAELRQELADVAAKPYVVFHDAYQYFETRYGLSPAGAITISPDRAPGARTLTAIRDRIETSGALCVFREPQFEPALVTTVVEGTPARTAVLDPLGADLDPGPDAYFTLMRQLAGSLSECLTAAAP